jgi:FAD/FMN-containing dehydrogenase
MAKPYIGYNAEDLKSELAPYFNAKMAKLQVSIQQIINDGPLSWDSLDDLDQLNQLELTGYQNVETGYTQDSDGSIKVAIHTIMPDVSPSMWDWWFGWHSSQDRRYKLWHPEAHFSARWEDGKEDVCYVGRTSIIKEYIGKNILDAAIQFKSPIEFGFSNKSINNSEACVYICAKIGHPKLPVDYGYLVHQVRKTETGAEMRSRFFLGGRYVSYRKEGKIGSFLTKIVKTVKSLPKGFAPDLLRHCSEEMNHLAIILPELYNIYSRETDLSLQIAGNKHEQHESDFHSIMMGTLFNKKEPGVKPSMIVAPRTIEDIIRTIKYAKNNGKRITISSGGHSFSANFIREDCVLILMKHFDGFSIDKENMTAQAGPGVGGSVLMKALYNEDLFFPAGHCKGVCIGGYLLQGGYGWNGRKLGIACQSIIGMDIITSEGVLVHANERENADLFWAARGSGPGFFGIVVKFYLKVYPLPKYRAIMAHNFAIKHWEDVYRWAYDVGPSIPKAVEFQMIMSRKMLNIMGPGIEAFAPIFADTKDEFEEAKLFMHQSPIKQKAVISTPAFNPGIDMLYKAAMEHYPSNYHWGVDNIWTHAPIEDLLPFIKLIADSLPPAPSHFLWLNWHPGALSADMAYSKEDKLYLALYSCWKNAQDTALYDNWASDMMRKMEHLSVGIQLADEGLHKRTAAFMSESNLEKVQQIRAQRDPNQLFYEWHSKPN